MFTNSNLIRLFPPLATWPLVKQFDFIFLGVPGAGAFMDCSGGANSSLYPSSSESPSGLCFRFSFCTVSMSFRPYCSKDYTYTKLRRK